MIGVPPEITHRIEAVTHRVEAVMAWPLVVRVMGVMDSYGKVRGGLLAGGLAYGALFAAITGLMFLVGVLGIIVSDPAVRESIVEWVAELVPVLEPIVRDGLIALSSNAGAISIIGLVGLAWGASQFYGALDATFALIFSQSPQRGMVGRTLRGLAALFLLVVGVLGGVALSWLQGRIEDSIDAGGAGGVWQSVSGMLIPILTGVAAVGAVAIIYRLVPNTKVPVRILLPPAIAAGIVLAVMSQLFVILAPLLTGDFTVFGGVATVFVAMAWLSLTFQVLLIGAVWTNERLVAAPSELLLGRPATPAEPSRG